MPTNAEDLPSSPTSIPCDTNGQQIESGEPSIVVAPANVQQVQLGQANGQQVQPSRGNIPAAAGNGNVFPGLSSPQMAYGSPQSPYEFQLRPDGPSPFHQPQLHQATYSNQQNWVYQPLVYALVQHRYGAPPGYPPYLGYHTNGYGNSHGYPLLPGQHPGPGTGPVVPEQTALVLSSPQALASLQPQTNQMGSQPTTAQTTAPTAAFGVDPAKLTAPSFPTPSAHWHVPPPSVAPPPAVMSGAPSADQPTSGSGGVVVVPVPASTTVPSSTPIGPAKPAPPPTSQAPSADALDNVSGSGSADEGGDEDSDKDRDSQSQKRC
ncbi:hypothetical protein FA13DRAFT_1794461 [Coprinellus micaceus]|uniref:Uncharacterized protein n=1 Tax=Coprinellus micaceus TaxID=71717 RepID=A0A4Y7T1D1_COPMI|nr:hypothetical protein FA13DRAFT_1794461 [Coprinellus micaceus]